MKRYDEACKSMLKVKKNLAQFLVWCKFNSISETFGKVIIAMG